MQDLLRRVRRRVDFGFWFVLALLAFAFWVAAPAFPQQCKAPAKCIDPATIRCGTLIPESCEDYVATQTRIFRLSEGPPIPEGLLGKARRVKTSPDWSKGKKITAAHRETLLQLTGWLIAYAAWQVEQPPTPLASTGFDTRIGFEELNRMAEALAGDPELVPPFDAEPFPCHQQTKGSVYRLRVDAPDVVGYLCDGNRWVTARRYVAGKPWSPNGIVWKAAVE